MELHRDVVPVIIFLPLRPWGQFERPLKGSRMCSGSCHAIVRRELFESVKIGAGNDNGSDGLRWA